MIRSSFNPEGMLVGRKVIVSLKLPEQPKVPLIVTIFLNGRPFRTKKMTGMYVEPVENLRVFRDDARKDGNLEAWKKILPILSDDIPAKRNVFYLAVAGFSLNEKSKAAEISMRVLCGKYESEILVVRH